MGTRSKIPDIPVYVISLPDSVRRGNMAARLNAAGIPFEFFDAADGRYQRFPDVIDGARIVRERFGSEGGIGSTVSHRLLHRIVAEGPHEMALILEDDALPAPDFREVLRAAARFEFDLLKLEGDPLRVRTKVGQIGPYSLVIGTQVSLGGAAYLLRRAGAAKLCSLSVLDQMVDVAFSDPRIRLRVLQCEPYPVVQDRLTPTTMGVHPTGYFPNARKPRLSRLQRVAGAIRRRRLLWQIYGPTITLKLELEKLSTKLGLIR